MTNDCKTCPVSTGTHKPAEAVHHIDEPQAEALRLAAICESKSIFPVADELRRQHARIAELESQLESIGAGGVEPLRKQVAAPQAVPGVGALYALQEAEAALELAIHRILKRDPGHAVHVTSEAKALVAVRAALDTATHPTQQWLEQDAERWRMVALISKEVMIHPDKRTATEAVAAYMRAVRSGLDIQGAIDAALAAQAKQGGV